MINLEKQWTKHVRITYLLVLLNWNNIKKNTHIMEILDMDTNKICQNLKEENPQLVDYMIQSYVLTMLITIKQSIVNPALI